MFRSAIPTLRVVSRSALASARPAPLAFARQPIVARTYAAAAGLKRSDIEERVMEVMKTFEKVDGGKVRLSHS